MKTLWLVNPTGVPEDPYKDAKYRLGWWDEKNQAWQFNDQMAVDLLALLDGLKWGSPGTGEIPNLAIMTSE